MINTIDFHGIEKLYGKSALEQLRQSHIMVIGIGGIGTWCVEALCRSGIGELTLVDMDEFCITNLNRQHCSNLSTIGKSKIKVLANHCKQINPGIKINLVFDFFTESTKDLPIQYHPDLVIDCIDGLRNKILICEVCFQNKIPLVSVGGAGGRIDPTQVRVADLGSVEKDQLLRRVRRVLKKLLKFPIHEKSFYNIDCVFSIEYPRMLNEKTCEVEPGTPISTGRRMDCEGSFGSASFVTGTFGFVAVSRALKRILNHED